MNGLIGNRLHQSARVYDFPDKGRKGLCLKARARRFVYDDSLCQIACNFVAVGNARNRFGTFENGKPDIDGVAVKYPRERVGDYKHDPRSLDRDGCVFAGRTAAEIILRNDHVSRFYFFYKFRVDIFHAVSGEFFLAARVEIARRNDHVGIDVVSVFVYSAFPVHSVTSAAVANLPRTALAAAV